MKRTTIMLDEQQLLEAQALAQRQGTTFTAVVQAALERYIQAHRAPRRFSCTGIGFDPGPPFAGEEEPTLFDGLDVREGWSQGPAPGAERDGRDVA